MVPILSWSHLPCSCGVWVCKHVGIIISAYNFHLFRHSLTRKQRSGSYRKCTENYAFHILHLFNLLQQNEHFTAVCFFSYVLQKPLFKHSFMCLVLTNNFHSSLSPCHLTISGETSEVMIKVMIAEILLKYQVYCNELKS